MSATEIGARGDQKTRLSGAPPLGVVSPRGLRGPGRYGSNRGLCCEGVGKLGALGHADAGHWGQGPRCLSGLARALHKDWKTRADPQPLSV